MDRSAWIGFACLCHAVSAQAQPQHQHPLETVETDCVIDASVRVKVSPPVLGVIAEVKVNRGDRVRAGDVIARLEAGVEDASVAIARGRAENVVPVEMARVQAEYRLRRSKRLDQLRVSNNVPESQADEASTDARVAEMNHRDAEQNLKLARLELRRAEELLRQRIVVSPVDGVVIERALSAGEFRHEQGYVVTIAQLHPLYVEAFLPITHYRRVRVGQSAEILPNEPIGGRYKAKVVVVDQVFDTASGTFGVRLELPNPDYALPAGLRCRLRLDPEA